MEYENAAQAYIKSCEINSNSILSNLTGSAYHHLKNYHNAAFFYRQSLDELNKEAASKKKGLGKTEITLVDQMNEFIEWYEKNY